LGFDHMAPEGDRCPDRGNAPAAGPAATRKSAKPPPSSTAAAAPGQKRGLPLTRPKQQVHKHHSYATLRKLEAELLAKQRQLGQLEQQHDQLCQNVRVMQQIVVSGQDVLQAAASHISTLSTSQEQRLAALNSGLGLLTQEEQLLHTLYTASTKAVIQATDGMGFARLLSAATRYGKQLLEEGGPNIMQQEIYQRVSTHPAGPGGGPACVVLCNKPCGSAGSVHCMGEWTPAVNQLPDWP
jgi:hypothetical protein